MLRQTASKILQIVHFSHPLLMRLLGIFHLHLQFCDNTFFQTGYIRLGNTETLGDILLCQLLVLNTVAHLQNLAFPLLQCGHCLQQLPLVFLFFKLLGHDIIIGSQNIREQKLISVLINIEWFIEADLHLAAAFLAQKHQDFIFNTA